jgi:pullulanase/glycogen debranching enzyme
MWFNRKHLVKHFKKVEGEFTLATTDGIYKGTGTDSYIATNVDGEQSVVSRDEFEKNFVKAEFNGYKREDIREALMNGYPEMGDINLGISHETIHSEEEAEQRTINLLK